jgi:hypothetical protein
MGRGIRPSVSAKFQTFILIGWEMLKLVYSLPGHHFALINFDPPRPASSRMAGTIIPDVSASRHEAFPQFSTQLQKSVAENGFYFGVMRVLGAAIGIIP